MIRKEKIAILGLSTLMIFSNFYYASADTYKVSNQKHIKADLLTMPRDDMNSRPRSGYGCQRAPLLRESIDELEKNGALSEKDVKNIDAFMKKERDKRVSEVKDEIYKEECTKIDKMVSENVITKDQGEKLKATVKENLESFK